MITAPARWCIGLAALGLVAVVSVPAGALAADAGPTVAVTPVTDAGVEAPTAPGTPLSVTLEGWPGVVVTVAVCGNEARRGSADCDQIGSKGVGLTREGSGSAVVRPNPPGACPCVVRVSTPTQALVRTAPVDLPWLPTAEPVGPVAVESSSPSMGTPAAVVAADSPAPLVVAMVVLLGVEAVAAVVLVGARLRRALLRAPARAIAAPRGQSVATPQAAGVIDLRDRPATTERTRDDPLVNSGPIGPFRDSALVMAGYGALAPPPRSPM